MDALTDSKNAAIATMRTHQEIDARSLALHRLVADKLRQEPARLEDVKATLARWRQTVCPATQPYLREWELLIEQGLERCLAVAVEESEHATALRQQVVAFWAGAQQRRTFPVPQDLEEQLPPCNAANLNT